MRLQGQEDGVDIAELMIEAGFAKKSVDNCIFGLEAEVELELFWGFIWVYIFNAEKYYF